MRRSPPAVATPDIRTGPRARAVAIVPPLLVIGVLLCGCGSTAKQDPLGPKESPADLYVDLAEEYLRLGKRDIALQAAERALAEDKKSGRAHYMLAIVEQRLGREQKAEKHFAEAVRLEPDNPDFRTAWGLVLCTQGRYDDAIAEIETALSNPLYENPEVGLMSAARCAERHGRDNQAETYLRQALTRAPNYAPALFAMAERKYTQGAYEDARNYLARYSGVGVPTPQALLLAARIEQRLGNRQQAKALAAALRQRYPDAPQTMQLD